MNVRALTSEEEQRIREEQDREDRAKRTQRRIDASQVPRRDLYEELGFPQGAKTTLTGRKRR